MPTWLRMAIVDGWCHVVGRGWERRRIFADDGDRTHLVQLLAALTETYRVILHGYVG